MGEAPQHRPLAFPQSTQSLRSTAQCPYCFAAIEGMKRCGVCGLDLTLPQLVRVFNTSVSIAGLLDERAEILNEAMRQSLPVASTPLDTMPAEPPATTLAATPAAQPTRPQPAHYQVPEVQPAQPVPPQPAQSAPYPPVQSAPPGHPVTPISDPFAPRPPAPLPTGSGASTGAGARRTMTAPMLLLGVGITFLAIAAIVFLTVAFSTFGLTTKAVITAGITLSTMGLASFLRHRDLRSTAEGIAVLGGILLTLDAWAIQALNFFGLGEATHSTYWGAALIILSGITTVWGRLSRLRAPTLMAALAFIPGVAVLIIGLITTSLHLPALIPLAVAAMIAGTAVFALPIFTPRALRAQDEAAAPHSPASREDRSGEEGKLAATRETHFDPYGPPRAASSVGQSAGQSAGLPAWMEAAVIIAASHIAAVAVMLTPWTSPPPLWGWVILGQLASVVALVVQMGAFGRYDCWAGLAPLRLSAALVGAGLWMSALLFLASNTRVEYSWSSALLAGLAPLGVVLLDASVGKRFKVMTNLSAGLIGVVWIPWVLVAAGIPLMDTLGARVNGVAESFDGAHRLLAFGGATILASVLSAGVYRILPAAPPAEAPSSVTTVPEPMPRGAARSAGTPLSERASTLIFFAIAGAMMCAYGLPQHLSAVALVVLAVIGIVLVHGATAFNGHLRRLHGYTLTGLAFFISWALYPAGSIQAVTLSGGMMLIGLVGALSTGTANSHAPGTSDEPSTPQETMRHGYATRVFTLIALLSSAVVTAHLISADILVRPYTLHIVVLLSTILAAVSMLGAARMDTLTVRMMSLGALVHAFLATVLSLDAPYAPLRSTGFATLLTYAMPALICVAAAVMVLALLVRGGNSHGWISALLAPLFLATASQTLGALSRDCLQTFTDPQDSPWLVLLTPPHTNVWGPVIATIALITLLRRSERHRVPTAVVIEALVAYTLFLLLVEFSTYGTHVTEGVSLLMLVAVLVALGAVHGRNLPYGPPVAWAGMGVLAVCGHWFLNEILTNPWPIVTATPVVVAMALSAAGFATRPASLTDSGRWLTAALSTMALLVLGGSILTTAINGYTTPTASNILLAVSLAVGVIISVACSTPTTARATPSLAPTFWAMGVTGGLLATISAPRFLGAFQGSLGISGDMSGDVLDRLPAEGPLAGAMGYEATLALLFPMAILGVTLLVVVALPPHSHTLVTRGAHDPLSPWGTGSLITASVDTLCALALVTALLLVPVPVQITILGVGASALGIGIGVTLRLLLTAPQASVSLSARGLVPVVIATLLTLTSTIVTLIRFTEVAQDSAWWLRAEYAALVALLVVPIIGVYMIACRHTAAQPLRDTALACAPLLAWSAAATMPIGYRWWPIAVACLIVLILSVAAVMLRQRHNHRQRLIAALVSLVLPLLALSLPGTSALGAGIALTIAAAAGMLLLFASPDLDPWAVAALRITLSAVTAYAAYLAVQDLPPEWQVAATLPAAALALMTAAGVRFDPRSGADQQAMTPVYAALAVLLTAGGLLLSQGNWPINAWWAAGYAGFFSLVGLTLALWMLTRPQAVQTGRALSAAMPLVASHLAAAFCLEQYVTIRRNPLSVGMSDAG